jgi:hypothetical protein
MFDDIIRKIFSQEQRVKSNQLSEAELRELVHIVDLRTILKYQKLSIQFINDIIIPLIREENKSDPTRQITIDDVKLWQNLDESQKINF